jgi:hypothetical protein
MNRRGFFSRLGLITAAFTILPSATTYARIWTPPKKLVQPMNTEMPFRERDFAGKWRFLMSDFKETASGLLVPKNPFLELCSPLHPYEVALT